MSIYNINFFKGGKLKMYDPNMEVSEYMRGKGVKFERIRRITGVRRVLD